MKLFQANMRYLILLSFVVSFIHVNAKISSNFQTIIEDLEEGHDSANLTVGQMNSDTGSVKNYIIKDEQEFEAKNWPSNDSNYEYWINFMQGLSLVDEFDNADLCQFAIIGGWDKWVQF